jgi:hypothetical protein
MQPPFSHYSELTPHNFIFKAQDSLLNTHES